MLFYATLSRTQSYATYLFVTGDVLRQCEVGVMRTRRRTKTNNSEVIDLHLPYINFVISYYLTLSFSFPLFFSLSCLVSLTSLSPTLFSFSFTRLYFLSPFFFLRPLQLLSPIDHRFSLPLYSNPFSFCYYIRFAH